MEIPLSIGECIVSTLDAQRSNQLLFLEGVAAKPNACKINLMLLDLASQKEDPREQSRLSDVPFDFQSCYAVGTKSVSHLLISISIHVDRGM